MHFPDSTNDFLVVIAKAADVCMKPWQYSVVDRQIDHETIIPKSNSIDLIVTLECRSKEGIRHPKNDLDLEIYTSGSELNLTLSWSDKPDSPILWQGQHPVWMDGITGKACKTPDNGREMESLARKIRSLFISEY